MNINLTINIDLSSIINGMKDAGLSFPQSISLDAGKSPDHDPVIDDMHPDVPEHVSSGCEDDLPDVPPVDPGSVEPDRPEAEQAPISVDPVKGRQRFTDDLPVDPQERKRELKRRYNAAYRAKAKGGSAKAPAMQPAEQAQSTAKKPPSDASVPTLTRHGLIPAEPSDQPWTAWKQEQDAKEREARNRKAAVHAVMMDNIKPDTPEMEAFLDKQEADDRPKMESIIRGMFRTTLAA